MSAEHNNKETEGVHYERGSDIPIFSPPLKDKDAEDTARHESQRAYEGRQISIQTGILVTQIALVIFGLGGAGVSLWQARTAQQSIDTSDKSVLLAQKTERDSRKATEDQARQSAKSLEANISNFHQDQRAWLSITSVTMTQPYTARTPGTVTVALANTGKTPALHTRIFLQGFASTEDVPLKPNSSPGWTTQAPGSTLNTLTLGLPPIPETTTIFIRFKISYRDVFQKEADPAHITSFCGFYPTNRPPYFFNCPHGGSEMN